MGAVPFLLFGNLNNGVGNYGLSYANVNNGLTNANWNIASRPSVNSANVFLLSYNTHQVYPRCGENRQLYHGAGRKANVPN